LDYNDIGEGVRDRYFKSYKNIEAPEGMIFDFALVSKTSKARYNHLFNVHFLTTYQVLGPKECPTIVEEDLAIKTVHLFARCAYNNRWRKTPNKTVQVQI